MMEYFNKLIIVDIIYLNSINIDEIKKQFTNYFKNIVRYKEN